MANGTPDIRLDVEGNFDPLIRRANNLPSLIKPIKLRVDSSALGTLSRNTNEFNKSLQASSARVLAFGATASILFSFTRALKEVSKATIEVEKSLADINVILNLSNTQLNKFSQDLFKVANLTSVSFADAAKAATEFSRQGISVEQVLKRTTDALTLTRLSGLDVISSVEALTSATNTFTKSAISSSDALNKIIKVDGNYAVSARDLAEALTRVGSTAEDAGVSFDQLLGAVTSIKQITQRDGAVIGNSLKSIFLRIERPEVLNQLKELGVLTEDYTGKNLSAIQILTNLSKSYQNLSEAQQSSVTNIAAGLYQANQFKAILSDLSKENSIFSRATLDSASATNEASRRQEQLNKTLSSSLKTTLNNLTQFAAEAGKLTFAPAFENIFSSINSTLESGKKLNSDIGENLGLDIGGGILKGIGNYLSGPGLLLGTVLLGKLFGQFASFTGKSLAGILEGVSSRFKGEAAINNLIANRPALQGEILALGNKEIEIQKLITRELIAQSALLNQQASVKSSISQGVNTLPLQNRPFNIRGDGEQATLVTNVKYKRAAIGLIPQIQESVGALKGGYNPGIIKQLNIPKLGNVIYNGAETVKKFPGLSQPAILPPQSSRAGRSYKNQFTATHGFNPYKSSGHIPDLYAAKGLFGGTFGISQEGQITLSKQKEINATIAQYKTLIEGGVLDFKLLNESISGLANKFNLTQSAMDTLALSLRESISKAPEKRINRLLESPGTSYNRTERRIQDFVGINGINPQPYNSPFLNEDGSKRRVFRLPENRDSDFEKRRVRAQARQFRFTEYEGRTYKSGGLFPGESLTSIPLTERGEKRQENRQQRIEQLKQEQRIRDLERIKQNSTQLATSQFQGKLNKTGDFGFLLNYKKLQKEAEITQQLSTFNNRKQSIANKALLGSFILPQIAGIGEQSLLNNFGETRGGRGAARLAGGVGNISSYALTGLGLTAGNPVGAIGGAAIGIGLELPSIIKAFSDTLPDLEKRLEKLTDSSQRTSTGLSQFIDSSTKIQEILSGNIKVTNQQFREIQRQQAIGLSNVPTEVRGQLRGSFLNNNLADTADIASRYNSILQNTLNTGNDEKFLREKIFKDLQPKITASESLGLGGAGQAGNVDAQKAILKSIDARRKKQFDDISSKINPILQSNVLFAPTKSGKNTLDLINNDTTGTLSRSLENGNSDLFVKLLGGTKEFTNAQLEQFASLFKSIEEGVKKAGGDPKSLLKEFVQTIGDTNKGNQEYLVSTVKYSQKLSQINKILNDLVINGSRALGDFDVKVLRNFNKSITDIDVSAINRTGKRDVSLLNAGNNNYFKNFLDFQNQKDTATDVFDKSSLELNKNLSSQVGNTLLKSSISSTQDIYNNLKDNALYKGTGSKIELDNAFNKRRGTFNNVFSDFVNFQGNNTTLKQNEFSNKDLDKLIGNTSKKIQEIEINSQITSKLLSDSVSSLEGQGLNKFSDLLKSPKLNEGLINAFGSLDKNAQASLLTKNAGELKNLLTERLVDDDLIKQLTQMRDSFLELQRNIKVQAEDIQANLDSTNKKAEAEFENNKNSFGTQFAISQSRLNYTTGLDIGLIKTKGTLGRQSLISNPYEQLDIQKRLNDKTTQSNILTNLQENIPGLQLKNIGQINSVIKNKQSQLDGLEAYDPEANSKQISKIRGEIEKLIDAQKIYNSELKKSTAELEEQKKNRELELKFSANRLSEQKRINTNLAAQGKNKELFGKDNTLSNIFGGLEFSREEFFADLSNNVQSFSVEFKDSIKQGFAQAIKNGKDLKGALEDSLLDFATNQLVKTTSLAIDGIFGALTSKLNTGGQSGGNGNVIGSIISGLGSAYANSRAKGGYIPKFAKGGYVNMGSGTKDDVPAFLSGGEFVLKKSAVNKIGKQNLDILNNTNDVPAFAKGGKFRRGDINSSGAITKDSFNITGDSARISLANSYEFNNKGKRFKGISNTSPLLSSFALTDENNPQNKLRFSREQYVLGRREFEKNKRKGLAEYEKNQKTSYYVAFGSALFNAGSSAYGSRNIADTNSNTGGSGFGYGKGALAGNSSYNRDYDPYFGTNFDGYGKKNGGYIQKFEKGGQYFGGDSPNDRFGAMLTKSEYVIRPEVVKSKGVKYFENLNNAGSFAAGGYVGGSTNQDNSNDSVSKLLQQILDTLSDKNTKDNSKDKKDKDTNNKSSAPIFNINITTTLSSDGSVKNSKTNVTGGDDKNSGQNNKENATKISKLIEGKVKEVLILESKPGGMLNDRFASKK